MRLDRACRLSAPLLSLMAVTVACSDLSGPPAPLPPSATTGATKSPATNDASPQPVSSTTPLKQSLTQLESYQLDGHVREILSFSDGEVWAIGPAEVSQSRPGEMFLPLGWTLGVGDFGRAYLVDNERIVASGVNSGGVIVGRTGRNLGVFQGTCEGCPGLFTDDIDGNLWFAKDELTKYNAQGNLLKVFSSIKPTAIAPNPSGGIYFTEQSNLKKMNQEGLAEKIATIPAGNPIANINISHTNKLIISTKRVDSGINLFAIDEISGASQYIPPPNDGDRFISIFADSMKNAWSTTTEYKPDKEIGRLNLMNRDDRVTFSYILGDGEWQAWPGVLDTIWAAHNSYAEVSEPYPHRSPVSTLLKLRYQPTGHLGNDELTE